MAARNPVRCTRRNRTARFGEAFTLLGAVLSSTDHRPKEFWKGRVMQLRLSSRPLYDAEFQAPATLSADPDTIALYRFDDGLGDQLRDSSGHDRHGRIVGAQWIRRSVAQAANDAAAIAWVRARGGVVGVESETFAYRSIPAELPLPEGNLRLVTASIPPQQALSDGELAVFDNLPRLTMIKLADVRVGDAALSRLGRLPRLESMYFSGTQLTNAGLAELLPRYPTLTRLHIGATQVDDAGIPALLDCPQLTELRIGTSTISDAAIDTLVQLPRLNHLAIVLTRVTPAGIDRLRTALPECQIEWDGGTLEGAPQRERQRRFLLRKLPGSASSH